MSTPATNTVGGKRVWTRDRIIQELRDYAELYGPDFTTAAFNPSVAKWRDDPDSRERYLKGNPKTGAPWPALNTIRKMFGGFNAARVAAGLQPNTPGPSASRPQRAHHKHAPIRDVSDAVRIYTRTVPTEPAGPSPAELRAADRRAAAADKRALKAEERLEKANERLHDTRAIAREAKATATKLRARVGELGTTVSTVRDELRDVNGALALVSEERDRYAREVQAVRRANEELGTRFNEVKGELEHVAELHNLADPEELEAARTEVRDARAQVAAARDAQAHAEQRAAEADRAAHRAEAARRGAQTKAQDEARARREIQLAVAGHDKPLSRDELAALREAGPAGPAVFAAAIREVARAQSKAARHPLKTSLMKAAAAAVRWAERL